MSMNGNQTSAESRTLFGHPTGLYALFFAEMWERFSYYGMRALLIFYMTKGFLGYGDNRAYGVYGAYCALVYATPFIGGMLADRLLGARRGVILGGLLMAAGHFAMTVENETVFYLALALLICGNGFFKPNISTIVGTLYPKGSPKKDTGFTIFYMGINLGAAMSPVVCGYVGETFGWHYGFGLATAGMLTGVAVFVAPTRLTQVLIFGGALAASIAMPILHDTPYQLAVRILLAVSLTAAGVIAFVALGRGGLPSEAGAPRSDDRLRALAFPTLRQHATTYYLAIIAALVALQQVANPSSLEAWMLVCIAAAAIALPWVSARNAVYVCVAGALPTVVLFVQRGELVGYLLVGAGVLAFGSLLRDALGAKKIERERMFVILILMFFSMLFWAFFEQAGSSLNLFADRNVDRVFDEEFTITEKHVGSTLEFRVPLKPDDDELAELPLLSQELLGYECDQALLRQVERAKARQEKEKADKRLSVEEDQAWSPQLTRALLALLDQAEEDQPVQQTDEPTVSISVSPSELPEDTPPPGSRGAVFTFTRSGDTADPLTVRFDVSGTAEFDKDYEQSRAASFAASSGTVKIPAGRDSVSVVVSPTPDDNVEEDETIVLSVVSEPGYVPGDPDKATLKLTNDDLYFTMTHLAILREEAKRDEATAEDNTVSWTVTRAHLGMRVGGDEIPASELQAANPIFILLFGLVFSALWAFLNARGWEPGTPVKFALGLFQLGLGFAALWYGATQTADSRGMVVISWLLLGYLLHTTGELCLSPVGLSMVTKLSPTRIVSTVMGAWFLATAFSNYLAAFIATFTGVSEGSGGEVMIPRPSETTDVYGNVFGVIALTAVASALICFAIAPLLTRWMHPNEDIHDELETREQS